MNKTKYFLFSMLVLGLLLLVFAVTASASIHVDDTKEVIYIYDDEHDMQEIYADASVTDAILQNMTGGHWLLNYSIQVNASGSLVLTPTDHCTWLRLNDSDATQTSNITVHGKFYANDTMITGWYSGANSTEYDTYRPYIYIKPLTDADDTHAEFNTCQIGYLGFNSDNKYGIVYEDVESLDPSGWIHDSTIIYNHIGTVFQGCNNMWINNTDFDECNYGGMVWTTSDDGSGEGSDFGGAQDINITNTGGTVSADGMRTLGSDKMDFDNINIINVSNSGDGWHMDTEGNTILANNFTINNCAGWAMNVHNPGAGFTGCIFEDFVVDNCTAGAVNFSTSNTNYFYDFNINASHIGFQFRNCHNDTFANNFMNFTGDPTSSYGYHFFYEKDTSVSGDTISSYNYSIYIEDTVSGDSHNIDVSNVTIQYIGNEGVYLKDDTNFVNFYDTIVVAEDPDCGVWASAFYILDADNISIHRATINDVGGGFDVGGGAKDIYGVDIVMTGITYAGWMIDGTDVTFDDCILIDSWSWGVYLNSNNADLTFNACYIDSVSPAVYSQGNNSQGVWNNTWLSSTHDHVVEAEENATLYFYNCTGLWDDGGGATDYGFHLENATDVTIQGFYGMDVETNITTSGYNYHKAQGNYVNDLFVNINMFNMTITPSTNYVLVTVNTYTVSSITWTAEAIGNVDVTHVFNDLTASTNYYPFKDALRYGTHVTTSASGTTSWSYTDAWSEHDFALQTYSSTYSATTANLLDNVIPILVAVAGLLMIIGLLFTAGVSTESLMAVLVIVILMIVTLQVVFAI